MAFPKALLFTIPLLPTIVRLIFLYLAVKKPQYVKGQSRRRWLRRRRATLDIHRVRYNMGERTLDRRSA